MSLRLDGTNILSYTGVTPASLSADVVFKRDPTTKDYQNFNLMTRWLNSISQNYWLLVNKNNNVATWVRIISGGNGPIISVTGDTGGPISPVGGNINIFAQPTAGTTVVMAGSGNTLELNVTDALGNTQIGLGAGNLPTTGTNNTGFGKNAIAAVSSGSNNSGLGFGVLSSLTTGSNNIALGDLAANSITTGNSNIMIGSPGIVGDNNTIRIGSQGTGTAQQNTAFMAGIVGVTGSNENFVTINTATGQLGTSSAAFGLSFPTDAGTAIPASGVLNVLGGTAGRDINTSGSGNTIHVDLGNAITLGDLTPIAQGLNAITLTTGDIILNSASGNVTSEGIAKIKFFPAAIGQLTSDIYFYLNNVFIGAGAGNQTMTPSVALFNVGIGPAALSSATTATQNIAINNGALQNCTTGQNNVAIGYVAMNSLTTGSHNVAIGSSALDASGGGGLLTGVANIAIGNAAGSSYLGAESSNILIGDQVNGTLGESNVCRIAKGTGTAQGQLSKTFISGIRGITTGNADALPVLIDSAGQLGTISSSIRFKTNVTDLPDKSTELDKLRVVEFNFKGQDTKSWGLIAEEVEKVIPEMVIYDDENLPLTVRYQDLPILLLQKIQKQDKEIIKLKRKLSKLCYKA
jgi:hypothetical protein